MPVYKYSAKDSTGRILKGSIEADTLSELYERLEKQKLFCLKYSETGTKTDKKRKNISLGIKELVLFCRKVSTMLSAGMSITNCLDIMYTTSEKPKVKQLYLELYESVKGGKSLSGSMREAGSAFPLLLITMLESGEESGNMDMMMDKLSVYYEKQGKIASKIKIATTYPKLLCAVASAVILIIFTFVLPKIFVVFEGNDLPAITVFMVAISNFLINRWYICIVIFIALIILIKILIRLEKFVYIKDRLTLSIPKVGKLIKKIYSARFASTLAILYSSGLTLLNGIKLSMNVIDNSYIADKLDSIIENVSVGHSLSDSLEQIDIFDTLLPSMVRIGEETGSLDKILISMSDYYEQETETAIETLLAMLEPALIVVMAVIVGFILIAVMLPIFQSYSQAGIY